MQKDKLIEHGCEKIFEEKKSGASKKGRGELANTLGFVREHDILVITRLDRLARSLHDLTNITRRLDEQGVGLIVTDQDIDTTTPTGRLLFHMIGAIAEFERDLIGERTEEGRKKAKNAEVKFGRKVKLSDKDIASFYRYLVEAGSVEAAEYQEFLADVKSEMPEWLEHYRDLEEW